MTLEYASLGPESGFPVMSDPVVDRAFDAVRAYQKELDYTPSPDEEVLEDIIESLDELWPYNGSAIGVSGRVKSAIVDQVASDDIVISDVLDRKPSQGDRVAVDVTEDGQPLTKQYFVNDQSFQSLGFGIEHEPWPELIDREEIGKRAVIKLMLRRFVDVNLDDGSSEQAILHTTASIHEVSLDLPSISDEMAEMWSRDVFPEAMGRIDTILDSAETVAQKLLALRKVKIPCYEHTIWHDKLALEQSLHALVGAEEENMPFVVRLRKGTPLFKTDSEQHQVAHFFEESAQHLIIVHGVRIYNECGVRVKKRKLRTKLQPNNFELRIGVQIIGARTENDSEEVEIRLADIKDIKNVRQLMLGAED